MRLCGLRALGPRHPADDILKPKSKGCVGQCQCAPLQWQAQGTHPLHGLGCLGCCLLCWPPTCCSPGRETVRALTPRPDEGHLPWHKRPAALAIVVLALTIALNIIFY